MRKVIVKEVIKKVAGKGNSNLWAAGAIGGSAAAIHGAGKIGSNYGKHIDQQKKELQEFYNPKSGRRAGKPMKGTK